MDSTPAFSIQRSGNDARLVLSGMWTAAHAEAVEEQGDRLLTETGKAGIVTFDTSGVVRLDTLGAWVLDRACAQMRTAGAKADFAGLSEAQRILLHEVAFHDLTPPKVRKGSALVGIFADVGESMCSAGRDVTGGVAFLGGLIAAAGRTIAQPRRFRPTSVVFQLEAVGFYSVPIVALISFLVGCIIAQQGIFQLRRFGAVPFVVDLTGILTLRELGVLLTSIMIAGRSGSAFTAEIGSMKMREEIDALRVMGLDPMEVLVLPRILALIIALPLLTFIADMSALLGGGVVAWIYGGIGQEVFLSRLREAVGMNTFLVGIIKAPFMALVIGIIACIEGMAVKGSAELLGRQVTSSVVKSIFMVIVVDGLFAMFFAAIKY